MKLYELTYLISSEFSEEELENFQKKINSFIQEEGGILEKSENPIKRKLEYPIKKKGRAYLVTTKFRSEPEKLENLDKRMKKEPSLLRYMIFTKKEPEKIKIPEIRPKTEIKKIKKEKKVELEKIDEKLNEILGKI
jgi:small subunit ribosomal protein S6